MLPLALEREFHIESAQPKAEQILQFESQPLKEKFVGIFNPQKAIERMIKSEGKQVLCIDIGAKKAVAQKYSFHNGEPLPVEEPQYVEGENGRGYLPFLEHIQNSSHGLPITVSSAGVTQGSKLVDNINIPEFVKEFYGKFRSDFGQLFPALYCLTNDGIAATISGATVAARDNRVHTKNILSIVNGGGLGTSILIEGKLHTVEAGHTKLVEGLNPHNQEKKCGGACDTNGTCVKSVIACGAGIEDIYLQKTGKRQSGNEISALATNGDELAIQLYLNSAKVLAHLVLGLSNRYMSTHEERVIPTIICHGGCFQFDQYGKAFSQYLEKYSKKPADIIFTKNFSDNACMDGAAIAGVYMR